MKKLFGSMAIMDASSVKFYDADSSNFIALKSASTVSADLTFTLPAVDGTNGQALITNASGALSWASFLSATLSTGYMLIGNGSNVATATDLTTNGDVSASSTSGLTIKSAAVTNAKIATGVDAVKIADGSVTNAEFQYLGGVTSDIQTQFTGKASTALDNLTVSSLAAGSLLVGSSSSAVANLAVGTNGQVLTVVTGSPAWATPAATGFATDWDNADGASLTVTHSLGTRDVIVQIFDTDDYSTIEVDSVVRTDTNTVDLTASSAPAVTWRVLIKKI